MSKGHIAAQIARDAATNNLSPLYIVCSGKMCWDAAIECQVMAGVARPQPVTTLAHDHVISLEDGKVENEYQMQRVPQGASIGIFRGQTLIHFMIAVGAGSAAGNKNACIGIGSPVGWEIINLANGLTWKEGGFECGDHVLKVRYRAVIE